MTWVYLLIEAITISVGLFLLHLILTEMFMKQTIHGVKSSMQWGIENTWYVDISVMICEAF